MLKISRLTVEHLARSCVTDNPQPRISFQLESNKKNVMLEKAEIQIGNWNIETDSSILIPYTGTALQPFSQYRVMVRAVDNQGEEAQSETIFETGRMKTPWDAEWITDGEYHFKETRVSPRPMTFRKKIPCRKPVKICASLCHCNGNL